jgi:ubiquinone/menaquinone biosynthesis C-methylase UbiE
VLVRFVIVATDKTGVAAEGRKALPRRDNLHRSAVALALAFFLLSVSAGAHESEIEHLMQILQLKPGSSVADVGAGSGELSLAIAERVGPEGKVYSTEIKPVLVDKIRTTAEKAHLENVIPVEGKENDTGLPHSCCDAIFLREVYHHLTDPLAIDHSLYQALRPGARLAIIDFEPIPGQPPPAGVPVNRGGHGVPKHLVAHELVQAGFELIKTSEWPISPVIEHYCMLFKKPFPHDQQNTYAR